MRFENLDGKPEKENPKRFASGGLGPLKSVSNNFCNYPLGFILVDWSPHLCILLVRSFGLGCFFVIPMCLLFCILSFLLNESLVSH